MCIEIWLITQTNNKYICMHTYKYHKYIYVQYKERSVNFQQLANHKAKYAAAEALIIPGNAAVNKYCRNTHTHTYTRKSECMYVCMQVHSCSTACIYYISHANQWSFAFLHGKFCAKSQLTLEVTMNLATTINNTIINQQKKNIL